MTFASPLAADSFGLLVALRFGIGLVSVGFESRTWIHTICIIIKNNNNTFQGGVAPAATRLIAQWAPPNEKGKFMSAMFGTDIGTVLTWSICGVLIETFGWSASFYGPGLVAAVFAICWYFFVFDSPEKHPGILPKESEYIRQSLAGMVNDQKVTYLVSWLQWDNKYLFNKKNTGMAAIWTNSVIRAVSGTFVAPLWTRLGPILPLDGCAQIHEWGASL